MCALTCEGVYAVDTRELVYGHVDWECEGSDVGGWEEEIEVLA